MPKMNVLRKENDTEMRGVEDASPGDGLQRRREVNGVELGCDVEGEGKTRLTL